MKRFVEEAKRMIRINSVSTHGNEEVANYVATLMQDKGLKTHVQQVTHSNEDISKRQFNVIGILGDPLSDRKIRKGLLLSSHLDTVSPGILENWTETGGDPFAATIKDGRIYGLGAADAKLDFLCKLHALEKFREKKLKNPIYLVGTCGKEIGMFGVKYLIKSLALNPRAVLVGGPTELKLVYGHKSSTVFRVSIEYQLVERDARGFNRRIDLHSFGRSAHSSTPSLGTNAILNLVEFLHQAMENGFEMRFTRLDGGDAVNKVPDHSVMQFYLRSHQFEDFKRFFRDKIRSEGRERSFRVELGGVGDAGVRFLPEQLFSCLSESVAFLKAMMSEMESASDKAFDPPCSTVSFAQLKQKMTQLQLHCDMRFLPDLSEKEIETKILRGIQSIATRFPSLNITVLKERANPGLNMSLDDEWIQVCRSAMQSAGIEAATIKKSSASEAAHYFQADYPALAFGPGDAMGNSHGPNENCILEQLEKSVLFYEKVIERVCL